MKNLVKTFTSAEQFKAFLKTVQFVPNEINRPINSINCDALKSSVLQYGLQREINIVETSILTGTKGMFIIDGQHLVTIVNTLDAELIKGTPSVRINITEDVIELIGLMSTLNSTGKKWGLDDYARAWANQGIEDYVKLLSVQKELKISLNTLIMLYHVKESGNTTFKSGKFRFAETSHTKAIKEIFEEAVDLGMSRNAASFGALVRLANRNCFSKYKYLENVRLHVEDLKRCTNRDRYETLLK